MRRPLYAHIALFLTRTLQEGVRAHVKENAELKLANICHTLLPNGSGFDEPPVVEHRELPDGTIYKPQEEYLIRGAYHPMDEVGNYKEWVNFTIRVVARKNFLTSWDLEFLDTAPKDEALADLILESYIDALGNTIDLN